ncbi:hypothetical protein GCM10022293_07850 [Azospirillum formosense]
MRAWKSRRCRPDPQARSSTGPPDRTSGAKRATQGEGGLIAAWGEPMEGDPAEDEVDKGRMLPFFS